MNKGAMMGAYTKTDPHLQTFPCSFLSKCTMSYGKDIIFYTRPVLIFQTTFLFQLKITRPKQFGTIHIMPNKEKGKATIVSSWGM